MLQIFVAVASAFTLAIRVSNSSLEWWIYLAAGISFLTIGWSMLRIGDGIRKNNISLAKAAAIIGDDSIPKTSNKWRAVSHWIALSINVTGVVFLVTAYLEYCKLFNEV